MLRRRRNSKGGAGRIHGEVRAVWYKHFGDTRAVDQVSFEVLPAKILALLGPSGCGKTTTLRCIAGLERPEEGDVLVDGQPMTAIGTGVALPPDKRDMGMVFQSYAIWPHMTVAQNVAYPLKARRVKGDEVKRRVDEVLDLVGLSGFQDRPATKLSGGQQQRVALARAIVARPRVLLFDEPLSNLDAKLRARMRFELLRLQREVGITSVYVTHDQAEAMAIADELIVMNRGKIEQRGDARSLYLRPANTFVADFIGAANAFRGTLTETADQTGIACLRFDGAPAATVRGRLLGEGRTGDRFVAVIRPEAMRIRRDGGGGGNALLTSIDGVQYLGDHIEVRATVHGVEIRLRVEPSVALATGDQVIVEVEPTDCLLLPAA